MESSQKQSSPTSSAIETFFDAHMVRRQVPCALWRHHPVHDQSADSLARATLAFQAEIPSDIVKITPASSYQLRDLGQHDAWIGDKLGRRDFGTPVVTRPEDWLHIIEARSDEQHISEHLVAARLVRAKTARDVPVVQSVFDPMFQARVLSRGVWHSHQRDFPDLVAAAMRALTDRTKRLVDGFREAGVDGIFLAVQHSNADEDVEGLYESVGLPLAQECLEAAGSDALNLVHLHGAGMPDTLAGGFGNAFVHFSFSDNTALRTRLDSTPSIAISGGLQPDWLLHASCEDVQAATHRLIEEMRGRSFLLSAGCVLHPATPIRNIKAMLKAARHREGGV